MSFEVGEIVVVDSYAYPHREASVETVDEEGGRLKLKIQTGRGSRVRAWIRMEQVSHTDGRKIPLPSVRAT